ncbi:GMC oxidoreductase [Pararhizobium mangrovi]|uniref:GMC family oxidoreductase n=1 Tax=Pararhizobium mangrovi TaxID=2590452 RepID=A0A506U170_9HYPH|nr:GMC family oxidoreductase [Pararhizobium mangrovi]TPW28103.1 GMC family oxidoreductase [Pararhizobium mangrovi]
MSEMFDAIVVGSGPSGSFAAKELTDQGLSVLMIEAGREVKPEDFVAPKRQSGRGVTMFDRAMATLGGRGVQARAAFYRPMLKQFYVSDRDNPYTTPSDAPYVWIRGRQGGGRSHVFGRMLLRWSDDDFRSQSRYGSGVDWPFDYAELAPYYEEVERLLELRGNRDGLTTLPDSVVASPAALTPAEESFRTAVETRWPERRVIAWRSMPHHSSRRMAPLRAAQASGRLTERYDRIVRRVLVENGRATGVEIVDSRSGTVETLHAGHVVICASPIETVRLLFNSADDTHKAGLANSSGELGRYFMDQLPMLGTGIYPEVKGWSVDESAPEDPFYGRSGGIFIPRFETADPAERGQFDFQGAVGRSPTGETDPSQLLFFGFGRMEPDPDNRVTLDPRRRDRWGIPVPHVRCRMGETDRARLQKQEATFIETVNGAGGEVEFVGSPNGRREWGRGAFPQSNAVSRALFRLFFQRVMVMGAAIHETGGARMGTDPANSVLNGWGQAWDVPNLWICDASAFPGSGVSGTTLTIMAQAVRACRRLAQTS